MPNKYGFCRERTGDIPTIAIPFWAAAIVWFMKSYALWNEPGRRFSIRQLFAFTGFVAIAITFSHTGFGPMPAVIALVLSTTYVVGRIACRLLWIVYCAGRKKARPELFVEVAEETIAG